MSEISCFVLASRLIPDQDGGFAHAVMRRADDLRQAGFDVVVLTVDPASTVAHDAHREEWARRGELADVSGMRNLFDDARSDAGWLIAAAQGTSVPADLDYNDVVNDAGVRVLSLPVITGDPRWHASDAPVIVYDEDVAVGSVPGFGGLYRAWLDHVVGADPDAVVIVEARQLGELLTEWQSPARLIHTIHTNHLEAPYTPDASINALWSAWFDLADKFDAVAWPTSAQARDVQARFGEGRNDVVAANGVDIIDVLGPAPTKPRAVMVNRLSPGKRIDHAIRAWSDVTRAIPDAKLDIYGDGSEHARLADLIRSLNLETSVTLHGHVSDVEICYLDASVFVLTTAYEGQGLVVGEALGTGTPVISYDVTYGPQEALSRGGGILVPSGDEQALVTAILAVLQDDEYRAALSLQAHAASKFLSREIARERWAELVRDVASRPARRLTS